MTLNDWNRQRVRDFLDGPFGSRFRDQIFRAEATREAAYVKRQSEAAGLMETGARNFIKELRCRNEETFFILGSGSSVEDDAARRLAVVAQGVSVGINAWVLHDFVPTFYAYEPVPSAESDHFQTLSLLDRSEILGDAPHVLVLRPRNLVEFEQLSQIPESLYSRTVLYGRVAMVTRKREMLERDIRFSLEYLSLKETPVVTLDSGATIVRMTSLALQLGFRKIVFVGVDLNDARYFWERNPAYLVRRELLSFASGQTGCVHETLNSDTRPFAVTDAISGIYRGFAVSKGAEMYAGSKKSELTKVLPVFSWR